MKRISIVLIAALLLALAGCGAQKPAALRGNLLEYDLGESTLLDGNGREVTYEVQGVLGIPKEKNCPVVVLVHGSHPIEKASESRYDKGFEYLAQSLSEQGNLVISMNVAINYSFENGEPNGNERTRQVLNEQLTLLKKAVDGDKRVFGYDLTGAGDFGKLVLMGHSRGGPDMLECAGTLPDGMKAVGIVCVAPSEYKVIETAIPNVPIGIIIPQRDGDVISLDGSNIYEEILADGAYTATEELIYLKNANHAYFNSQLTEPDLNHSEADLALLMPPEQQRGFLLGYLSDFVKNAVTEGQPVFASAGVLESRAYDCDVLLRVHSGEGKQLWNAESADALKCTGSATETKEIFSSLPAQNTVGTFSMPPLSFESYAIRHLRWDGPASGVTIPAAGDVGDSRFVDIDMTIDSTDPKNTAGQSMTLTFADADGKTAQYAVGRDAAALLWQEGTLAEIVGWEGETVQEYSTYTPLVTLRVALSALEGIDLSRLQSVTLTWDESAGGSAMLRGVSAVA